MGIVTEMGMGMGGNGNVESHSRTSLVSVSHRRLAYLNNHKSKFHQKYVYMLPVAVVQSSSGCSVIRYVFPVLWMTPCFHQIEAMGQKQRAPVCFVQFARSRHQSDVRRRCLVEIVSWQMAMWQYLGRCLPPPTASC